MLPENGAPADGGVDHSINTKSEANSSTRSFSFMTPKAAVRTKFLALCSFFTVYREILEVTLARICTLPGLD